MENYGIKYWSQQNTEELELVTFWQAEQHAFLIF